MPKEVDGGLMLPLATVSDCLHLPTLSHGVVRGGHLGLSRHVRWVASARTTERCAPGEFRIVAGLYGADSLRVAAGAGAAAVAAPIVSDEAASAAAAARLPVIGLAPGTDLAGVVAEILDFVVASLDSTLIRLRQVSARLAGAACDDLRVEHIAETLAAVTGTPILLTDAEHRLLCAVGSWPGVRATRPGTRVTTTAALRAECAHAAASGQPRQVDVEVGTGGLAQLIAPIRAGGELLGFCTAVLPDDQLGRQVASVAVEQAMHLFALALVHQQSADLGGRFARSRLLVDLLSGGVPSELLERRAQSLGVDLAAAHTVVLASPGRRGLAEGLPARALAALSREPSPLADLVAETLVVLVPGADRARVMAFASRLATELGPGTPVVVGGTVGHSDIPAAYLEARRLLQVSDRAEDGSDTRRVVDSDRLGIVGVLVRAAGTAGINDFWRGRVGALVAYDTREGTDLCGSLAAFFETGSARAAAQRLGVHPNSLSARLQRAETVGAFSLQQPEDRLELDLALRCHKLLGP